MVAVDPEFEIAQLKAVLIIVYEHLNESCGPKGQNMFMVPGLRDYLYERFPWLGEPLQCPRNKYEWTNEDGSPLYSRTETEGEE